MKSTLVLLALGAVGLCWGQAPPDCKPNLLNVPEAKYPCIFPDNRVMYRIIAPNAQAVRVGNTNLTKGPDNIWSGTTVRTLAPDGGTPELRSPRRTRTFTSRKTFLAVA
jgi:hypothetical protein